MTSALWLAFCDIFQHGDLKFLKSGKVAITPSPSDFDGFPYPQVRWYPYFFFIKMTAKDVKEITYIELDHFL